MAKAKKEGQGTEKRQRTATIRLRLTPAEKAEIEARAERAGMASPAYLRQQALGEAGPRSVRRLPVDAILIRQAIGQMNYVGNNLNQLARRANMGDLDGADARELAPVLRKINDTAEAFMSALGRDT